MTRTEERLRNAFADAAQTVGTGTLDPLVTAGPRRRRSAWWIAPVAAAASVGAVVAGTLALRTSPPPSAPQAPAAPVHGGPHFIVSLMAYPKGPKKGNGGELDPPVADVRDASTGHIIAHIPAPSGLSWNTALAGAAAAADDRHFVLIGAEFGRGKDPNANRAYRLTLDEKGRPGPLHEIPGTQLTGAIERSSLSPDGDRLAVNLNASNQVKVVDLATGRSRTWADSSLPGGSLPDPQWMPDGRHLITVAKTSVTEAWIKTFDTQGPGTDLAKSGAVLARLKVPDGSTDMVAGPDGKDVFVQVFPPDFRFPAKTTLLRISVKTGQVTRTLAAWTERRQPMGMIALAAGGRYLLVRHDDHFVRVDGQTGQVNPLAIPVLDGRSDLAW